MGLPIILASRSPRRVELLKFITDNYIVVPSCFDENKIMIKNPSKLVEELSFQKANAVKEKYKEHIIIGCDTVVSFNNEIFTIPKNYEEAYQMINKLSGNTHIVTSGVTVLYKDKKETFSVETRVTFYELEKEEIEIYLKTDEPYDKAGGYGIQSKGGLFVKEIKGDYYNVVGLPLSRLNRVLKEIKL